MQLDKEQKPILWTEKENSLEQLITDIRSSDAVITTGAIQNQQNLTTDKHMSDVAGTPFSASFL